MATRPAIETRFLKLGNRNKLFSWTIPATASTAVVKVNNIFWSLFKEKRYVVTRGIPVEEIASRA